jgi:hypothetical protein
VFEMVELGSGFRGPVERGMFRGGFDECQEVNRVFGELRELGSEPVEDPKELDEIWLCSGNWPFGDCLGASLTGKDASAGN